MSPERMVVIGWVMDARAPNAPDFPYRARHEWGSFGAGSWVLKRCVDPSPVSFHAHELRKICVVQNTAHELRIRSELVRAKDTDCRETCLFPPAPSIFACGGRENVHAAGRDFACVIWEERRDLGSVMALYKRWLDEGTGLWVKAFYVGDLPRHVQAAKEELERVGDVLVVAGEKLQCWLLKYEQQTADGGWILESRAWLSTRVPGFEVRREHYVSAAGGGPNVQWALRREYGDSPDAIWYFDEVVGFEGHPAGH